MRGVTADTHTWLAAHRFLLQSADDFHLQFIRAREAFDAEAIHDLRVSARRLREGISIFSGCFSKRRFTPIRQKLKSLTGMLGAIRNCDEALLFFSPLAEKCDLHTRTTVMPIIAMLQKERAVEQHKLKRELKRIDPGSLLDRIYAICSNPRIFKPGSNSLFVPVATSILAAVAVREKTILELLPVALIEENVASQHRLRIAVKHFRYRMEFLAPFAGRDYKAVYSTIKEYQEILGQMHDLDVFIGLLADPADEVEKDSVLRNIINERRKVLFTEFIHLNQTSPLDKMGDLIRGLL